MAGISAPVFPVERIIEDLQELLKPLELPFRRRVGRVLLAMLCFNLGKTCDEAMAFSMNLVAELRKQYPELAEAHPFVFLELTKKGTAFSIVTPSDFYGVREALRQEIERFEKPEDETLQGYLTRQLGVMPSDNVEHVIRLIKMTGALPMLGMAVFSAVHNTEDIVIPEQQKISVAKVMEHVETYCQERYSDVSYLDDTQKYLSGVKDGKRISVFASEIRVGPTIIQVTIH